MIPSKSKIDKLGRALLQHNLDNNSLIEENAVLDYWRQTHLTPLTEATLKLQEWLLLLHADFSIAQRLKRKPQIIRKLKRSYPMKLSQMQDIGGCRAIFKSNHDLEDAWQLIKDRSRYLYFTILRETDYRENGRDESGYRAVHLIADRKGFKIEIQLRTLIQHAWAEEVERTSIVCESPLKEGEGPAEVIAYFHCTSDALHMLECGRHIPQDLIEEINEQRIAFDNIVGASRKHLLRGFRINKHFIKGLKKRDKSLKTRRMKNWILIFNWNTGTFDNWTAVKANPIDAAEQYSKWEKQWKFRDGYEVVLIGATSIDTLQETHSHYFGINTYDDYLRQITETN